MPGFERIIPDKMETKVPELHLKLPGGDELGRRSFLSGYGQASCARYRTSHVERTHRRFVASQKPPFLALTTPPIFCDMWVIVRLSCSENLNQGLFVIRHMLLEAARGSPQNVLYAAGDFRVIAFTQKSKDQ